MSCAELLNEYEPRHDFDQSANSGTSKISNVGDEQGKFTGPQKFTNRQEPLKIGDGSIYAPTVNSGLKISEKKVINDSNSPVSKRQSQLISPNSFIEEKGLMNKIDYKQQDIKNETLNIRNLGQTNITMQPQKEVAKNFIKLVMAKSYFNHFIENMLQRSYVKKLSSLTLYQNTMLDDLRYVDSKQKIHKNKFGLFCKKLRFLPILDQSSYLVICWQLLHVLTILIIFFWTPFNISFGITYGTYVFPNITVKDVEFYFLISIVFDAFVAINTTYIEKGVIIKSRRKIFLNYLNGQAIYDMCSFVSMLIAIQFNINDSDEKISWQLVPQSIYYGGRLFKLQNRVHKLEEFFNFTGWIQDLIELIKLLFMVVYVGHLFACLWHGVAFYQIGYRNTWLEQYQVVNQQIFQKYNYAFYWAVQTMITVGYGDITPQNDLERMCANISMFLACGVFAFSFNSIGLMLSNLNSRQVLYKRSTNLLNQYLLKNQIKIELQSRIRNYYDYIFQEEQEINDEEVSQITTKLSSNLQEELNFEIRLNVMKSCSVLTKFSQKTLKHLSQQIEEVRFSPEDQIILQNSQDDCSLYIITKGIIAIQFQDEPPGRNVRVLQYLEKGNSFGEYSFFTGLYRTASAKSLGFSRAYKITRQQLLNSLQINEIDHERFSEIKDSIILSENYQPAKMSCYSCQKFTHLIKDCPILHYVIDKEKIIKKENFPANQDRNITFKRKQSIRSYYPTLQDMKKTNALIHEYQARQNQYTDNVTLIEDELDVSYDDGSPNEQEYSSFTKSYSKISRQQSQNVTYSQQDNQTHLQPIQESDDSIDSPSPNKQRNKQNKPTLQTAGFGVSESIHNRLFQEDYVDTSPNQSSFGNQTYKPDDQRFTYRNDSLGPPPSPIMDPQKRQENKKSTLIRKQKREESYKPYQSQSQIDTRDKPIIQLRMPKIKELSNEPITPSLQSVIKQEDKRDQKRKSTKTKTNRSRTAKTHKTTKALIDNNPTQEISIPVFEQQAISMELEGFETIKNFLHYFSWNNPKVVVARTQRIMKINLERKRIGNQFSVYTFNALAINKIIKIKRKLKLIDDVPIDIQKDKKSAHPFNKTMKGRRTSKRNTSSDDVLGIFQKKPQFGTQIQTFQGTSLSRFSRNDF